MSDARTDTLAAIRHAIREPKANVWDNIPRNYRHSSNLSQRDLLALLTHRLHDYDAQVLEVSHGSLVESIAAMLLARGISRVVIPRGFPAELLPEGFIFVPDENLSYLELNRCEGVLTQSTLAIAETGTVVLQNVPGQGRRAASLIPDYHLCLIDAAHLVATVPEAIMQLRPTAQLTTTFISGPSATADIEMTRIKGVHGPRFLDVILISD